MLADPTAESTVCARETERVLLRHVRGEAGEAVVILGFAEEPVRVSLPLQAGVWVLCLDAAGERFGGDGADAPETLDADGTVELTVPPHAAMVLARR